MTEKPTQIITLKELCAELKLDARECRERLRGAVQDAKKFPELAKTHKARTPWQWVKGSAGEKEARALFSTKPDAVSEPAKKTAGPPAAKAA